MKRRDLLLSSLGVCAGMGAWAQGYPNRPVRLVVPFPAGGATDIFTRALSVKMAELLGTSIVIENKPGAGGSIGVDAVAKAAPDGYTLLLTTSSTHSIGPSLYPRLPYDPVADFTPLCQVGSASNIMLVPSTSPAKTVQEWVNLAKQSPGKLNYGSSGNGTIVHLTTELLMAQAGITLTHVPYKGTGQAMPDLIAGGIDLLFDSLLTGLPHVRDGRVRALGVTSLQRSPHVPDMPTVAETLPGFESTTWFGLYGPKALPAAMVSRLIEVANKAVQDASVKEKFNQLGVEGVSGTQKQFVSMVASETAKWKKLIVERKISIS